MKTILTILFLCLTSFAFSQVSTDRAVELKRLQSEAESTRQSREERVRQFTEQHGVPREYLDRNGNRILMIDVRNGEPLYITADNAGAAITTGVPKLRDGGGLGLDLEGEGMVVGIWDEGLVSNHIEFSDRLLLTQGAQLSVHSSHVTGTVISAGTNNAQSKGMAPKAKAYTFDFDNDEVEMLGLAKADETSLLFSNHSYGLITGWKTDNGTTWQWFGNASISTAEDYKFGYYSNNARRWDEIAFNAPYYTIVKSAGNDRSDAGNGNFPADCNGGAGYDCLSDISTAKNIIVVGAVNKIASYTNASSVVMSSFSSWGPTDDGRIKPDLVGAGVNLISTSSGTNNYTTLSGTSMAAPNVTGSLVLLQELHKKLFNQPMKAATLKALAIHTTKEAGANPGPDYSFGWGLLDVEAAAKVILNKDDQNVFIKEVSIAQGQQYELPLSPKANQKITATIAWTDPAGVPVTASLDPTDIMLVNDLDLTVEDDAGTKQFPWILDPAAPTQAATRGNNIRDNVEKIEFSNPEQRTYKLIVRHKGTLKNGSQNFSLIVTYTSLNDPRLAYYWIGKSGNWENPANWSFTSGGPAANSVPGSDDRVIVDENSFNAIGQTIALNTDVSIGSLTWLTKSSSKLSLNSHTLSIDGSIIISSSAFEVSSPGIFSLTGQFAAENILNLANSDMSKLAMIFDGSSTVWKINSDANIGTIQLNEGNIDARNIHLTLGALNSTTSNSRVLNLSNSTIEGLKGSSLTFQNLLLTQTGLQVSMSGSTPSILDWNGLEFEGQFHTGSDLTILSGVSFEKITVDGDLHIEEDISISDLTVNAGAHVEIEQGKSILLTNDTHLNSTAGEPITFTTNGLGHSSLMFTGHFKLCFDFLVVDRVDIAGTAVINAGTTSTITDSEKWIEVDCADLLFPDFEVHYTCEGGWTKFDDISSGTVETWAWDFGDTASNQNTSTDQHAYHTFTASGNYVVTLTVSNGAQTISYPMEIVISSNPLPDNKIVINNTDLFSFRSSPSYEWFKDGELIEGAVLRNYNFGGEPGLYFVVINDGTCNRPSTSTVITGVNEVLGERNVIVSPNPSGGQVTLRVPQEYLPAKLYLLNSIGQNLMAVELTSQETELNLDDKSAGIYFAVIEHNSKRTVVKLAIRK